MRHVHVQPHADRVGGDEVVDLARLEHRDLRVAGARGERAHHHRRAAAQPPQHLGDGVHLLGAERDDRRALGQAADLLGAGIGQGREARPADDLRLGHQRLDHRPQRLRPQEHRLLAPARAQQPVGEDVAALRIGAELRLVQRQERHVPVERHALGGAQDIARARRPDLLLAGDQRHLVRALDRHHPVVHLARQQAQREADDAAGMAAQPLDRQVRLARVGRAEDRGDGGFHDANIGAEARRRNGLGGPARPSFVMPEQPPHTGHRSATTPRRSRGPPRLGLI